MLRSAGTSVGSLGVEVLVNVFLLYRDYARQT